VLARPGGAARSDVDVALRLEAVIVVHVSG
jgi:hypothetical protein